MVPKTRVWGMQFTGLLCLLCVGTAHAQTKTAIHLGGWTGGPVFSGGKQAQSCAASATNAQGISVTYSVDRDYRWRLSFSNSTWSFSQGYALNVLLRLGDRTTVPARARVGANQQLDVETEDELQLFAILWGADKLQVTAGGLRFE